MEPPPGPSDPPIQDAATVVLLRDGADGLEVFMLRRHERMGFMGGAYVFPGGKLDPSDADLRLRARCRGRSAPEAAAALDEPDDPEHALALHVAAIRETWEESGILLADGPDAAAVAEARHAMERGRSFTAAIEALDAALRLDRLVPYARWVTPAGESHRYDTRFFLTEAPPGQEARHDGRETTEGAWLRPGVALAREESKAIFMAPPTVRTLRELDAFHEAAAVLDAHRGGRPPLIRPIYVTLDGVPSLTLPGDPEHPEDDPALPGATRIVLRDGRWVDDPHTPIQGPTKKGEGAHRDQEK